MWCVMHVWRETEFLTGLACGLTAGAILGLLLAPKPGRDSRQWITARSREVGGRAKTFLHASSVKDILRRRGVLGLRDAWQQPRDASLLEGQQPKRPEL